MNKTKDRMSTIRLRTWTLTLVIFATIILYLIVNVTTNQAIDWIDFAFLCVLQILIHTLYFPDGNIYGQKDIAFINNKNSYNLKASNINDTSRIASLREYCKIEYAERKEAYIAGVLGEIGITEKEFELFKTKTQKQIKSIETFEATDTINGETKKRIIVFSKHKRKLLYNLLFKPLPVEENYPETIMSAVENAGNHAIKDGSITYKTKSYVRKFLTAILIGGALAYIGYKVKDGFGWEEVVSLAMYITTMLTSAVMAFSSGETCAKVYKSRFYLELANFIDRFNEWDKQNIVQNTTEEN